MMRISLVVALGLLTACGAPSEADVLENAGEQSEALDVPCTAYRQAEYLAPGYSTVCGTRPFDQSTAFTFTNRSGTSTTVTLQSGPDLVRLSVPAQPATTWWWHKYYGGLVRITPDQAVLVYLK